MPSSTSFRFPPEFRRKLTTASEQSNTPQAQLIQVAVNELFSRCKTPTELITAVLKSRSAKRR